MAFEMKKMIVELISHVNQDHHNHHLRGVNQDHHKHLLKDVDRNRILNQSVKIIRVKNIMKVLIQNINRDMLLDRQRIHLPAMKMEHQMEKLKKNHHTVEIKLKVLLVVKGNIRRNQKRREEKGRDVRRRDTISSVGQITNNNNNK